MKLAYLCLQKTREGQASHAHVHEIIKGLKKNDVSVDLFEPIYKNKYISNNSLGRFSSCIFTQIKLIKNEEKYDLFYIRAHYISFITALYCYLTNKKYIIEINGPIDDGKDIWPIVALISPLLKWFRKFEVKKACGVVVVTPGLKDEIIDWNNNIAIIPNGADTQLFHSNRKNEFKISDSPYVVFVGVLAKWQGIEKILKSVDSKSWPSLVKLIVVGDGVDRQVVEEYSNHNEKIIYLGKKPYRDVGVIISNSIASLVLVSSNSARGKIGASPLKLFEGMASGVPIIATDIDYMGDLVNDTKCGLVLPTNYDENQLAEAVNYLFENQKIANEMGKYGRQAIEKKHSWEKRAEATAKFIFTSVI